MRLILRSWLAQPGVIAAAIVSLALGIGANTALFSVAHALLLRPLPYADAERLVILWNRSPGLNITEDWFSTAQYFDIRTGQQSLEDVALAIGAHATLTGGGAPERIGTIRVSSNLLPLLGATPAIGRLFTPEEDAPGQPGTAVLSHGTWVRRFGGDRAALDRTIELNGAPYRVVGVLPDGFSLPREVLPTLGVVADGDVFLPLPLPPDAATIRTREDYNILGRLRRGARLADAQAELDALTARLRRDHPDVYPPNGGLTFSAVPLLDEVVGDVRPAVVVLTGAVGFVLLIACANVANLMLARSIARRREMSIRTALGATRGRLVRQVLAESLLLSLAGGALGAGLAWGAVGWMHRLQPANVPRLGDITVDLPVLLFTLALAAASALAFGLAAVPGLSRLDVQAELRDASRGASGAVTVWSRRHGLRRLLVIAELGLAIVLLAGAGLLIRSFEAVQRVAPGFDVDGTLSFELAFTGPRYADAEAVLEGWTRVWNALDGLPGVTGAGGVTTLPLTEYMAWGPMTVEGVPPPAGEHFFNADMRTASAGYFQALGIPLVRGRMFDARDRRGGERVVIVDSAMAERLWPGQDPVGRRVHYGDANSSSPWETVIGVVGRVRHYGLDTEPRIALYRPHTQSVARSLFVVVRSATAPEALARQVTDAVRGVDPDLPISNVRSMSARLDASLARRRFAMTLLALFAGLALVLAAVGTYGVMAYLVGQSTREVGIRLALGATPRAVLGLVLGRGAVVTAWGVGLGLLGAFALTRLMRSLLWGVEASDPATFGVVAMVVSAAAMAAVFVPARRAAAVDPVTSLRRE
ncbi:MAG: ABC transporter permease [Vicinamibacterales bacterium]